MKGNFSNRVRDVIAYSREEALRLGHDYIGTEHLLLGMIRAGESRALAALHHLGCDPGTLKQAIENAVPRLEETVRTGNIPLTKQAEHVLKDTYREAKKHKTTTIQAEHLLLSLIREKKGIARQILLQHAITYDAVDDALGALGDTPEEPAGTPPETTRTKPQGPRIPFERLKGKAFHGDIEPSGTKVAVELDALDGSPLHGGIYNLILREQGGDRRLSIVIGAFEAQAIALEREGIRPPRPMTHDLFKRLADGFDITLNELCIDRFKDGTFFCTILAANGDREVRIDARPSDAVALAVRTGAAMFADEAILAGVGYTDDDEE